MAKEGKIKTTVVRGIPQWATYYIEYGEQGDLTDGDVETVDRYLASLREEGYRLLSPIDGTEEGFNVWPAFGLPCSTVDYEAEVVGKEEL